MNSIIDSRKLSTLFGVKSAFFQNSIQYLNQSKRKSRKAYDFYFNKWKKSFEKLYKLQNLTHQLFLNHTYLYYLVETIILHFIERRLQNIQEKNKIKEVFNKKLKHLKINELFNWLSDADSFTNLIVDKIRNYNISNEDLFFHIYQEIINPSARHEKGEYYTPKNLARLMTEDVYSLGMKVIDCSCGSGIFLMEIIKIILNSDLNNKEKIINLNSIYGLDINPIAILVTTANFLLNIQEIYNILEGFLPTINFYRFDPLNPTDDFLFPYQDFENKFDLIIGNPPWLTYKDVNDKKYQIILRNLADRLGIKPQSQYITHIEIASLFFYQTPKLFLKNNGTIFLILTKSVLTGDHCFKFRAFKFFYDLEIWDFKQYTFFSMDFIILKSKFDYSQGRINDTSKTFIESKYPIHTKIFDQNLNLIEETNYFSVKIGEQGAKSIIPSEQYHKLIKISTSYYKKWFFQGATLVPRALTYFSIVNVKESDKILIISPDVDSIKQGKPPWNKVFYKEESIENNFHFKTFLNKDLVPFDIKKIRNIFLPVNEKLNFSKKYIEKLPYGEKFYNKINNFYKKFKKETSNINTLFDNLNYWNKLSKQNSNKIYLVVYNASGSKIKSAVINNEKEKIIICSENYYFSTNNKEEAYYLTSILNAPILSENIKIVKSSRHIHKRPFDFPIPKFDPNNSNHQKLSKIGMKAEKKVNVIVQKDEKISVIKVKENISNILDEINKIVQKII